MKRHGALPDSLIGQMIACGAISGASRMAINPASLDLSASTECYRLTHGFLPLPGESVDSVLGFAGAMTHSLGEPLEVDIPYLIKLRERLSLAEYQNVYAYCNPKSSIGRIDVHARLVVDGEAGYDTVPAGYTGPLWAVVIPRSFPVRCSEGVSLIQMRFFDIDTRLGKTEMDLVMSSDGVLYDAFGTKLVSEDLRISDNDGSIILTADTVPLPQGNECAGIVGYECRGTREVLNLNTSEHVSSSVFFEPIFGRSDKSIKLRRGSFYILSTKERVRVPPWFACEMFPMVARSGEFRAHYAGFIDPGWGYGAAGENAGRQLTLEVRPFEDIVVRDSQPIASIRFERMIREPDLHYDEISDSHYKTQKGPALSKYFSI
ncbi:MAG: hypothetical protein COW88_01495 [Candidatus Lloydbacteria bacterium CG22_combo_CG10-13_8_21_14_all_47_15]|uniref:2'-deoxycytidine 5'-triphosphate deaminase n=1 Tax=Candidatus Lloydbacteria bacterium CG22_combo_CG10-13_8_21_14_all_47_15 TaxID=1974635 RepID=A0A2H0CUJ7_9BACT|nr:MAG: hypothetical protein COW88_01495 [Candidatus Lloydbacteria bacterium CG22_combo_CG10-13_8_21_14_all_47_15]